MFTTWINTGETELQNIKLIFGKMRNQFLLIFSLSLIHNSKNTEQWLTQEPAEPSSESGSVEPLSLHDSAGGIEKGQI